MHRSAKAVKLQCAAAIPMPGASRYRQGSVKAFICTQVIYTKIFLTWLWQHDGNQHNLYSGCYLKIDKWFRHIPNAVVNRILSMTVTIDVCVELSVLTEQVSNNINHQGGICA
ncbi:hypothetical protein TNCV_3553261 [Trichonephila clavipes]|nr:hypothetical protein TNCV_3553261 [Trichonephila clavipes]